MRRFILPVLLVAVAVAGCSSDDPAGVAPRDTDYGPVLSAFSEKVVVGTYEDLAARAAALHNAAVALSADPTNQAKLDAAAAAWVAAREPWEAGEAFLFGPAAFLSLDPSLDSWPVDRQQLSNVLASSFDLTPEFVAEGLGSALRGFHTIEYLLFRDGAARVVGGVTAREREYLVAVTQVLADDAASLRDAWASGFAAEFAGAGTKGSRYQTQRDALLEMVEGMIGIADEVANGKIADPFDQQDPELVESQFSWNSLTDFQDNIRSIRNAYTGGYHLGEDGPGLDEVVAERDPDLDTRLKGEIDAAIAAIAAIPAPFSNHLGATEAIVTAEQAVNTVRNTFEHDVKPLIFD